MLCMQQVAVLDMARNEARDAVHVTDQPIEEGQAVTAVVDWDRRFDHMQQHTGIWAPMLCFSFRCWTCHTFTHCFNATAQMLFISCCLQLALPKSCAHPRTYCQPDFTPVPCMSNHHSCAVHQIPRLCIMLIPQALL